MARRRAYAGF